MNAVLDFLSAALPYLSMGIGIAVCVVYGTKNNR